MIYANKTYSSSDNLKKDCHDNQKVSLLPCQQCIPGQVLSCAIGEPKAPRRVVKSRRNSGQHITTSRTIIAEGNEKLFKRFIIYPSTFIPGTPPTPLRQALRHLVRDPERACPGVIDTSERQATVFKTFIRRDWLQSCGCAAQNTSYALCKGNWPFAPVHSCPEHLLE